MDSEILLNTIQTIPWVILLQISVVVVIGLFLKKFYDNLSSYLMFRSNTDIGINVKVKINGKCGYIVKYNWRFIYIKLKEDENVLIIPINRWAIQSWEICKVK